MLDAGDPRHGRRRMPAALGQSQPRLHEARRLPPAARGHLGALLVDTPLRHSRARARGGHLHLYEQHARARRRGHRHAPDAPLALRASARARLHRHQMAARGYELGLAARRELPGREHLAEDQAPHHEHTEQPDWLHPRPRRARQDTEHRGPQRDVDIQRRDLPRHGARPRRGASVARRHISARDRRRRPQQISTNTGCPARASAGSRRRTARYSTTAPPSRTTRRSATTRPARCSPR